MHTSSGALTWALSRVANAGGTRLALARQRHAALLGRGRDALVDPPAVRAARTSRCRFWLNGTTEPAAWNGDVTDSFWTSGRAALGVFAASGIATPFPQVLFDDFLATAG